MLCLGDDMNNKKDALPIFIAFAVALVVTAIIRLLIPGGTIIKQQPLKKELSLPDIPLMIKSEQKKVKEVQILVTNTDIRKGEKTEQFKLSWKSCPASMLQPHFIAQDMQGNPLNNITDYNNALNMWAKNDIPSGIPLVLSMLTSDDPVEVNRRKKEAEEKERQKENEIKNKEPLIRVGYRAVPFHIDQRTPISTSMISPGDYIDVLINSFEGNKQKTYIYKGLKIVAIDGITKQQKAKNSNEEGGLLGGRINLGGLISPKIITLEIKERMVDVMLKQAGNNGITVTVRSQNEQIEEDLDDESAEDDSATENIVEGTSDSEEASSNAVVNIIKKVWEISKSSASEILKESRGKDQEEEKRISDLLQHMDNLNKYSASKKIKEAESKSAAAETSKVEWVSGRIVSEKNSESKNEEEKDTPIRIYRKLTTDEVQFNKDGEKVKNSKSERSNSFDKRKGSPLAR